MKLNSTLLKATAVGALGGLLFGFDTAVIAGTTHSLTLRFGLTPRQLGLTVAMALIGTIIGAMSAGTPGRAGGGGEHCAYWLSSTLCPRSAALSQRIGRCCSSHALSAAWESGGVFFLGPYFLADLRS